MTKVDSNLIELKIIRDDIEKEMTSIFPRTRHDTLLLRMVNTICTGANPPLREELEAKAEKNQKKYKKLEKKLKTVERLIKEEKKWILDGMVGEETNEKDTEETGT